MTIEFHPLANLFPLIEGDDFNALVEDVRENGVRERIVLMDGAILDGRNRYRALAWLVSTGEVLGEGWGHRAGLHLTAEELEPDNVWFTTFNPGIDGDALKFVVSLNLKRRHLNDDQRRMVAARLANYGRGRPSDNPAECGNKVKVEEAARLVNVDHAGTERARTVIARAEPEIADAIDKGKLSVAAGTQAAKLAPETQRKIADEAMAGRANVVRTVLKKEVRDVREQQLARKVMALPDKRYSIILEDPEWKFVPYSEQSGMDRAPDNHYPTSDTAAIAARDVGSIAADDAMLCMWVTDLARGIDVMRLRGFTFKSYYVWCKDIVEVELTDAQRKTGLGGRVLMQVGPPGLGYWNRDRDELLLIGTRGNFPAPAPGTQEESVWFAARPEADAGQDSNHSKKPNNAHEWIERLWPNLPKIELNARRARPGWDVWGYEAPEPDSQAKADDEAMPTDDATASPGIEPSASRPADGRTSEVPALPLAGTPSPEPLPTVAGTAHGEDGGAAELPAASPPIAGDAHGCTAQPSSAGGAAPTAAAPPLFSDDPKLVELGKLRTVNHGDRADAAKYAGELIACGHAFELRPGDWGLTRAGLARAEALRAELGDPIPEFFDRGSDIPQFLPARTPTAASEELGIPAFLKRNANNVSPAMRGKGAASC